MFFEQLFLELPKTPKFDETESENFRFEFEIYENLRSSNSEKTSQDPPNGQKRSFHLLDTVFGDENIKQFI